MTIFRFADVGDENQDTEQLDSPNGKLKFNLNAQPINGPQKSEKNQILSKFTNYKRKESKTRIIEDLNKLKLNLQRVPQVQISKKSV